VLFVILEAVEVLVPLAAIVAAVRFVLFHAESAGIHLERIGVDDGEGPVDVGGELLGVVSVLGFALAGDCVSRRKWETYTFVVLEAVLILVRFLAADDGTMKRLRYTPVS